jgi:ATP-binding cassette subfamily B protein
MLKDLRTLKPYVRRYLGAYVLGCACLIFSNALLLTIPWLTKQAIDHLQIVIVSEALLLATPWLTWQAVIVHLQNMNAVDELTRPYFYGLLIIGVAAVQMVIRLGSRWFLLGNSRKVARDLRNALFAHLQRLSPSYYVRMPTGDLMSRAINDMQYVQSLVGPVILYLTSTLVIYLVGIPIMLSMSVELTLLALIPYPLFLITFKKFTGKLFTRSRTVQERLADLSARAQESISGIQIIKAYVREESESDHFRKLSADFRETSISLIRMHALLLPMMTSIGMLGMLVVLWIGGKRVIGGQISLGEFVAFNEYLLILGMPTAFLGMILSASQRGLAALGRINEALCEQPSIADGPTTEPFEIERGEIEIKGLSFTYPRQGNGANHRFGLKDVSLRVPAGTTLAIVGATGSGKTTLINLVARMLELEPGKIFIDGADITTIPLAELRHKIGVAPQESFLFSTTLKKNIDFGAHGGDGLDVEAAAQTAGLMPDVETFPKGFEARIGERGINLSGGQRQRTALARALLADPKILILDDAFSSVDTHTEERILENLKGELGARTAIIISHRVSTVKNADEIVVLDDGRIVEQGTHDELVEAGGRYAALYQRQLLIEELEELG